jgi:hypothetical protein
MAGERKIVIYCSASFDIDRKFNQAAREITRAACSLGYTIVSGGTVKGTMGEVADEVVRCGGRHIGVLPRFMEDVRYPHLDGTVWTDTMADRKEKMREGTCAAVALPGGIGTLDELIETLTLAKINRYDGKVLAFNLDGFFNPLISLLDHYVATGMLDRESRELIRFPETVEELVRLLK